MNKFNSTDSQTDAASYAGGQTLLLSVFLLLLSLLALTLLP